MPRRRHPLAPAAPVVAPPAVVLQVEAVPAAKQPAARRTNGGQGPPLSRPGLKSVVGSGQRLDPFYRREESAAAVGSVVRFQAQPGSELFDVGGVHLLRRSVRIYTKDVG